MTDLSLLKNLTLRDDRLLEVCPLVEEALEVHTWGENSEHDPYDAALQKIHKFIYVQSVSLLIRRGTDEMLVLQSLTDRDSSSVLEERYASGESFSGAALDETKTQVSNDISADPRTHQRSWRWWSEKLRPLPLKHGVFVPISGDLELRGVVRFFNRLLPNGSLYPNGFTDRDRQVLEFLAKLAAVQLSKIRLAERLTITSKSISSLHGRSTIEEVAHEVARTGVRLADAAAAAVFLPDPGREDSLKLYGSWGFKRSFENLSLPRTKSMMGSVVYSGKPLEVYDLQAASGASSSGPGKTEGMASYLALPLGATIRENSGKNVVSGVLLVYTKLKRRFHASTFDLLQQFALSAGSVIENHRRAQESSYLRQALPQVAHSLRAPMNRIAYLLREIEKKDHSKSFSVQVKDAISNQQLADARLQTMLLSKPGLIGVTGLDRQLIRIHDILKKCVARYEKVAWEEEDRHIRIDLRDFSRLREIQADPEKLDIVFDNLIENAVKYSWRDQRIVITGEEVGANVRVSIFDKGLGIPENMRERIFDRFARSDMLDRERIIPGTGLGLYVSKLIIEAHGGEITFRSIPFLDDPERKKVYEGYDTTFIVSLPREVI